MAKCDLFIELDQSNEVFHPGDTISGHVVVETDSDVRCDGLDVVLNWRTHGRGTVATGTVNTLRLFSGEWTGATTLRYAFQFTVPDGPVTYHGHYLNVAWFVNAQADIPWKFDPKAEVEFTLASGTEPHQQANWESQFADGYQPDLADAIAEAQAATGAGSASMSAGGGGNPIHDLRARMSGNPSGKAMGVGCLVIGGILLLAFVGAFGMWALDGVNKARSGNWGDAIPGLVVAAVMTLVILGLLWSIISSRMLKSRFGTIDHQVEPDRVKPGESVTVRVSFTPEKDTVINQAVVQLVGIEEVVSGSGTNRTTRRHGVHDEEIELSPERRLMARQPVILETELRIPDTAPPTFKASRNELKWKLQTQMDVARFPDWGATRTIVVMPR